MKWFNNIKLKTKLLSSFSIIALIVWYIGYLGYSAWMRLKMLWKK